jgi:uncharacterized protein with von Willebrand factor type A (vWA) domain
MSTPENLGSSILATVSNESLTESLRNAQINNGVEDFMLTENDLVVEDTQYKSQMSTVLMIDISHSMILYGEDRITPEKKVAIGRVDNNKISRHIRHIGIWK